MLDAGGGGVRRQRASHARKAALSLCEMQVAGINHAAGTILFVRGSSELRRSVCGRREKQTHGRGLGKRQRLPVPGNRESDIKNEAENILKTKRQDTVFL